LKKAAFLRTEIWLSAASATRTLLRCGTLLLLSFSAYWAIRLAWADHLSLNTGIAGRERAVQLAPAIANFDERLADKREELGNDSVADLRRAVSLDPENPGRRMRLGVQAELAGNFPLAEESLLSAAGRSNLYQPRYLLAQYYFRRQNVETFWRWSRSALEMAYGEVTALLDLDWRVRPDGVWIWRHAIPSRPEIVRQYLTFLAGKQQWEIARTVASQIAGTATAADRPILLDYCDRRVSAGFGSDAITVWNALCRRGLLPYQPLDAIRGPHLTGDDFERTPFEAGFDWRQNNPPGVACALRNHEIRLVFSGSQQDQCMILWQYVPVEPTRQYELKFGVRAIDTGKVDGIGWSVSELAGTELGHGAAPLDGLQFRAAKNSIVKVALVYQRPVGSIPLEGAVAVSNLSMERIP
jgi:hypothetical protein